jgi:hypothetical protein
LKNKVDLKERLRKLLQGEEIHLYVTRSSVNELTAVGEKATSALEYARTCCSIIEDGNILGETPAEKLTEFLSKSPLLSFLGLHHLIRRDLFDEQSKQ